MDLCLFSSALRGWQPARVADAARAAGLDAVEWGVGPGEVLESPRAAARALRTIDLEAAGICVQGGAASLEAPARLEPFAALAAELGAPHVRVFAPSYRAGANERAGNSAFDLGRHTVDVDAAFGEKPPRVLDAVDAPRLNFDVREASGAELRAQLRKLFRQTPSGTPVLIRR